ncbi:MAG TPA: DUF6116 family protein [Gemmatimonadales bacterium]|jgi:hypothetical protein
MSGILATLVRSSAGRLRYPRLLALTAALFVADLLFPDAVPLVDELLLGLGTLVLARLRTRRTPPDPSPPERDS